MNIYKTAPLFLGVFLAAFLSGCAGNDNPFANEDGETCYDCKEEDINAPVGDDLSEKALPVPDTAVYVFPEHTPATGVPKELWDKTKAHYDANWPRLVVRRYVAMINLGVSSSQRRFFLLDLKTGSILKYLTSHGAGSDPDRDGYATEFSNIYGSRMSSLGIYETSTTYRGKHGRSLRLNGLEETNNLAAERAVVMHSASYVSEKAGRARPSFGCPALDPKIAQSVITKLRGGAVLVIGDIKP